MFPAVIGIDLGSANVRWGQAESQGLKQPRIVPIGNSFEGIAAAFTITEPRDTHKIGTDALDNNPSNIIFDSTRVILPSNTANNKNDGAHFYAELHEEEEWEQYYAIRAGQKQFKYSVPEVIGEILNGVKLVAEEELGCPILRAVLTVPSMVGTTHRRMLQQASKIAGFEETKLINQSSAAALAFRHNIGCHMEGVVLVFSMGSRTTECSMFEFANHKTPKLCHSDGFFHFGGESFTERLVEGFTNSLSNQNNEKWIELGKRLDPEGVKVFKCKLRREAEKAKAGLSHLEETSVLFEPDPEFGPCQFVLNRSQFRKFCTKLVDKVNKLIVDALRFCSKNNLIINHVMLAGASSKLFIISELLKQHLPDATFVKRDAVPPGLAAVRGAAICAALWEAKSGSGPIPQCLGRLAMPDFAYHRLEAKQLDGTRCVVADVGMELPTRPVSIIFGQASAHIELLEMCAADKIVQKIGHCSNLQCSDCISLSLDENGLMRLEMKNQRQQTLTSSKFYLDRQKNVLDTDKLERACREMCEYNERIRRETEEAKRKWEEESRRMLEEQMKEGEEETEWEEEEMILEGEEEEEGQEEMKKKEQEKEEEEKRITHRKRRNDEEILDGEEEEGQEEKKMMRRNKRRRKEEENEMKKTKEDEDGEEEKEDGHKEEEERQMMRRNKRKEEENAMMKDEDEEEEQQQGEEEEEDGRKEEEEEEEETETAKMLERTTTDQQQSVTFGYTFCFWRWKTDLLRWKTPRHVYLCGSWDGWRNHIECELEQVGHASIFKSTWRCSTTVCLNPGRYESCYCIDGEYTDTRGVIVQNQNC